MLRTSKRFQSTYLREVRPSPACPDAVYHLFQSTYLREVRRHSLRISRLLRISIHVPARGTTLSDNLNILLSLFQSTYLREVRHPIRDMIRSRGTFQSTYLREVRLHDHQRMMMTLTFQSTYLREVRQETCMHGAKSTDFNPRTCERYDSPASGSDSTRYFNPRTCERYDTVCRKRGERREISIHVPARGTTKTEPVCI